MTKLPRLYVNGKFSKIVHPISAQITQNIEPLSTASITLPDGEELPARSYVELFTPYGSAGYFRVRSPHNNYGSGFSTAELEHMVAELGDYIAKNEWSDMYAADSAVKAVFSYYKGSKWKLGKYSDIGTKRIALNAKYDSVLNVLLSILDQVPSCMMTFDFTTKPWTLNIVKRGTSVVAEGRLSRNVNTANVTYDDSELVTRAWYQTFDSEGKGTWNSKDADTLKTYGIVESTVSTSSDMSAAEIEATVNTYLEEHKHPKTSVSIQAQELNRITGERMDKFIIGDLFRLNLRDYDLIVELNITSITWNDVYNTPDSVTVQLGEEEDTVVTFLHNLDSTGSGKKGGTGGGKKKKQDDTKWKEYFTTQTATDEKISLTAWQVNRANDILKQAGMDIDVNGVIIYAEDKKNNLMSKIDVKLSKITISSKRVKIEGSSNVTLNDVLAINGSNAAQFSKSVYIKEGNFLRTPKVIVTNGGEVDFYSSASSGIALRYEHVNEMIIKAAVSGNTLKLWKRGDNPSGAASINFSKAISSWEWGGGNGKVKVTAKPQNQSVSVDLRVSGDTTITTNGTYSFKAQYEDSNGSYWDTGAEKEITVNVPGSSYPYSKTMTCTSKNYSAGTWVYTLRYSVNNSSLWNVDQSYTFHHNSGYT